MAAYKFSERKKTLEYETEFPNLIKNKSDGSQVACMDFSVLKDKVYDPVSEPKPKKRVVVLPKPPKTIRFKSPDQYDWSGAPRYF
jgi:hypothetical protein